MLIIEDNSRYVDGSVFCDDPEVSYVLSSAMDSDDYTELFIGEESHAS